MPLAGWCGTVSPGDLATSSARDLAANTWLLRRAVRVALLARTGCFVGGRLIRPGGSVTV